MTDLPSTDWVIAVLETSRAGSMAGAAARLSLTHGAISRRIRAAEHWLGTPIFQRAGRGVHLTTQGMLFVRRAERSLGDIMALRAELSTRRSRGAVRISTLPSFARLWMMPRLANLEAALPGCSIDLVAEERLARLDAHDADLSIRYGAGSWPGVETHMLFEDFVVPAAAPRLCDIFSGEPPERLMRETLIIDCEGADWRTWCEAAGTKFNPTGRQRKFLDYDLALEAAREVLGWFSSDCHYRTAFSQTALCACSTCLATVRTAAIIWLPEKTSRAPSFAISQRPCGDREKKRAGPFRSQRSHLSGPALKPGVTGPAATGREATGAPGRSIRER